jgi:hypothetical protein
MTDWATISALATAGGTLVLAIATFSSVHSANRAARATERALLASIRPVLTPSRLGDPDEKIGFHDDHWLKVPGGRAGVEVTDEAIYLGLPLRNVGTGMAVLDRWDFFPERPMGAEATYRDPRDFRRLTRDLYIAGGDFGFWQGAFRDPAEPVFAAARDAINARQPISIDLLYGDHEGGQRTITRIAFLPRDDGTWLAAVGRHWNLDRDDPR